MGNTKTVFIGVKIQPALLDLVDQAVEHEDSDRSKFIRSAVRDRINRTLKNGIRNPITGSPSRATAAAH